jgi:hypothetical protein
MGSGHRGGGGGGIFIDIINGDQCGKELQFQVLILPGTEQLVWNNCNENDGIFIDVNSKEELPKIEVKKIIDNFLIGLVPPSCVSIIKCIKAGWKYQGKIIKKSGSQYAPEITVLVKGEF